MAGSENAPQVTVLGAGIVGICCALSLLEKGLSVRLIDRAAPATGASLGNAGVISPWSCVPQSLPGLWRHVPGWLLDPKGPIRVRWTYFPRFVPWAWKFLRAGQRQRIPPIAAAMEALTRPNVDLYRQHLARTGHQDLLCDSWYVHPFRDPDKAQLSELAWRLRRERGAPVERIDAQTLRQVEPALSHDYQAAILVKDQARATSPGRLGAVLADKARNMGAEMAQASIEALKPSEEQGWRLLTTEGEMTSANIVVSAGAWSATLLKPLGIDVPLEAERGYHLMFQDPGVTLNNSIMDMEGKFVVSSMEEGLRSAGTAEFAGLDGVPNYGRARIFESLTKRLLPGLNTANTREWMGTRPSFPDSLPCIGAVPGFQGLYAAFGHSHYGLGMAPATGRVIANLLAGSDPGIDLRPYRLDRFH